MENSEEQNEDSLKIPGHTDANSYCGAVIRSILAAVKSSNELPSGIDFDYYSTFKAFPKFMLNKGQSILSVMNSLIQKHNFRDKFQGRPLEDKFDLLEKVNDVILENVSTCLDEASGMKMSEEDLIMAVKPQNTINTSWNKKQFDSRPHRRTLLSAKNISRSQLLFKVKIDNSNSPFMPILKDKPNSIKPLAITLEKDNEKEEFCHPYETEIENFTVPDNVLEEVVPIFPPLMEETPLVYVSTEEQLKNLCEQLRQQKEFAVDLENHSYRSFQGFTCLIQISTRDSDFIIDALELRSDLHLLNDTFTDPKIVKVFHGANMDIIWLQRDFGVYVVNLFDTGQAAKVLHFAHLSLSYLLKHYCKLDVDKQFQLADWRIRPLPSEMMKYARQDTHYLLYIYDCLKNDLIKNGGENKDLLRSAFERSRLVCLKKYEKPIFSEDKYIQLYKKSKKCLNAKQLYCLNQLYSWRDKIARENDESTGYVLPNHMLIQIAETLPREQQGVLACCNPIPSLVRQQLNEIHSIILNAARSSPTELTTLELQQKAESTESNNQIDLNNLISCRHDILHLNEMKIESSNSSNLNTSLPFIVNDTSVTISSKTPSLRALFESYTKKIPTTSLNKVSDALSNLHSPFQRFAVTERLHINQEIKKEQSQTDKKTTFKQHTENKTQAAEQDIFDDHIGFGDDVICEDQNTTFDTSVPSTSKSGNFSSTPIQKKQCTGNKTQSVEQDISDDHISFDDDVIICEDQTTTFDTSVPSTSKCENFSYAPIWKKSKKRKAQPDVSLNCTPISQPPLPKKSKTPEIEVIDEVYNKFVPYDYSKTDLSSFSGQKKSKNIFKPDIEHNFKAHHGRNKKHFKQGTFGEKDKQEKKQWPQNK